MEKESFFDLSREQLYESFNHVRRYLSKQIEDEHSDSHDSKLRNDWLEKRPKEIDRQMFKALGITLEDIEKHVAKEGEAYRSYLDSVLRRDTFESADAGFGLPEVPKPNTSAAYPYAVVVIGKNQDAINEFDSEATGNPDAWKMAGFSARQEFFLELMGSGTGLYDFSFIPEYNTTDSKTVQWYFIHMPFGDGEWSCSAEPWFHGAYHVWSDDHFLTSRYARVFMRASVGLLPFGYPTPKYHDIQWTSDNIIDEGGQNINKSRWGGWIPNLSKLSPLPSHRPKPHWIIVSASGNVTVRGYSHARLDFARGYTSSGSVEGGSYRETKYGIYCHKATIHW